MNTLTDWCVKCGGIVGSDGVPWNGGRWHRACLPTPTDPTTHDRLRAALERLVDEAQAMRGNHGHRRTCDRDHSAVPNPSGTYHSCRTLTDAIHDARAALATLAPAADEALEALRGVADYPDVGGLPCYCIGPDVDEPHRPWCEKARAVLATPAPAADEARCGFMWSVDGRACGRPEDDERHTEDAFLFHPFQPAPTPAPPTPPATEERWVVVQGEDDDCGVCGGAKLRFVDPEYEPGGLRCTECDWFEPHPEGDHEWRRSCGMSCGNAPPTPPATEERGWAASCYCNAEYPGCTDPACTCSHHAPPATEPVAHLPECGGRPVCCSCHLFQPTPPATEPAAALVSDLKRTILLGVVAGDNVPVKEFVDASNATHRLAHLAARAEVDVERLARALHDGERGTDPTDRPYCHACLVYATDLAAAYREAADDR